MIPLWCSAKRRSWGLDLKMECDTSENWTSSPIALAAMLFYTQQLRMQIQSAEHWRWKSKILSLWVLSLMAHFWMSGKTLTLTGPCFSRTVHHQWWPLSCSKNARRHRIICFADEAFCSCTWNVWTSESMNNKCVYIIIYIIIYVYIYVYIYICIIMIYWYINIYI